MPDSTIISHCLTTFYSLDFNLFLPPLLPLLILFYLLFLCLSPTPSPGEVRGPDEHREAGTNQSIDLSTYPSLCSTDCQQKTKCLLSETFPISLPLRSHSLSSTLVNVEPVHPTETCFFPSHIFSNHTSQGSLTLEFLNFITLIVHL